MPRAEKLLEQAEAKRSQKVPGREAFDLLQTYGFPPELTETLAAERGLELDWDGFRAAQKRHEEASGAGHRPPVFNQGPLDELKKAMHGTEFVGYDADSAEGCLVMGLLVDDKLTYQLDEIDGKEPAVVVLDRTPFYGEMGGQVGDLGELVAPGVRFEVVNTQVEDSFILHVGYLRQGKLSYKDRVSARVNSGRRQAIRRAHSATHLLHYALRNCLGTQTQQKGSKVEPDQFRFDFNHDEALTVEQIREIEREVNQRVVEGAPVVWKLMPKDDAQKLGAMMLFGEKYPDTVRVVSVGEFSRELCGGTHLSSISQVGLFKITAEESIAKGIRRITALTGMAAWQNGWETEAALAEAAQTLKAAPRDVPLRVVALQQEIRDLKKKVVAGPKTGGVTPEQLLAEAGKHNGTSLVIAEVPDGKPETLRDLIDQLRRKASPIAVLLAAKQEEGKVLLIAGLSRELVEQKLDAVKWIREAAKHVQGGGGGRPDLAQAGGKDASKLSDALAAARTSIEKMLG
jgi:alanyl-tRNA synthetase